MHRSAISPKLVRRNQLTFFVFLILFKSLVISTPHPPNTSEVQKIIDSVQPLGQQPLIATVWHFLRYISWNIETREYTQRHPISKYFEIRIFQLK